MAAHYAPEQPPNPQWFLTRMTEMFRKCLAPTRGVELSTWVSRLFVAAFIIPWVVFAWMTLQERADVLRRLDDNRAALAATYQTGYRLAMIWSGAGALWIAARAEVPAAVAGASVASRCGSIAGRNQGRWQC